MSVSEGSTSDLNRRRELVARVMGFAELLQGLSRRFLGVARNLTLSGALAVLVLDLLMRNAWDWSLIVTILVGMVLFSPVLVVGWGWYVLSEAAGLPGRLLSWFGSAKNYAGAVAGRMQGEAAAQEPRGRFSDLRAVGGLAFEITSMGMDATGLLAILGGALSVTNPIYLLLLAISVGLIGVLDLIALISALRALF